MTNLLRKLAGSSSKKLRLVRDNVRLVASDYLSEVLVPNVPKAFSFQDPLSEWNALLPVQCQLYWLYIFL